LVMLQLPRFHHRPLATAIARAVQGRRLPCPLSVLPVSHLPGDHWTARKIGVWCIQPYWPLSSADAKSAEHFLLFHRCPPASDCFPAHAVLGERRLPTATAIQSPKGVSYVRITAIPYMWRAELPLPSTGAQTRVELPTSGFMIGDERRRHLFLLYPQCCCSLSDLSPHGRQGGHSCYSAFPWWLHAATL